MGKAHWLVIVLLCISAQGAAQFGELRNSVNVHVAPLSVIDPLPRYRFGAQVDAGRFGFVLDAGFGSSSANGWRLGDHWGEAYTFREFRPEIRMLLPFLDLMSPYIGLEAFFIRVQAELIDDFFEQNDDERIFFMASDFELRKTGANVKFGLQIGFDSRVFLDTYYGLGLRQKKVSYSNIQEIPGPVPATKLHDDKPWSPHYHEAGTSFGLSMALGIRIGYLLWIEK